MSATKQEDTLFGHRSGMTDTVDRSINRRLAAEIAAVLQQMWMMQRYIICIYIR